MSEQCATDQARQGELWRMASELVDGHVYIRWDFNKPEKFREAVERLSAIADPETFREPEVVEYARDWFDVIVRAIVGPFSITVAIDSRNLPGPIPEVPQVDRDALIAAAMGRDGGE